jgi:hypothetical protein
VVADLFARAVGFYPGWGLSRSLPAVSREFAGRGGAIDWRSVDSAVAEVLAATLGAVRGRRGELPRGVFTRPAELYMRVAVGQHASGWAPLAGRSRGGRRRLALLRCHVGKRRVAGRKRDLVLLQYRVWLRARRAGPRRVTAAAEAWPLLADLHEAVRLRLEGGGQR